MLLNGYDSSDSDPNFFSSKKRYCASGPCPSLAGSFRASTIAAEALYHSFGNENTELCYQLTECYLNTGKKKFNLTAAKCTMDWPAFHRTSATLLSFKDITRKVHLRVVGC